MQFAEQINQSIRALRVTIAQNHVSKSKHGVLVSDMDEYFQQILPVEIETLEAMLDKNVFHW